MNLKEIKEALAKGKAVYWTSKAYRVTVDSRGQYFIKCEINGYRVGLTWADGVTLNGKPEEFFTE